MKASVFSVVERLKLYAAAWVRTLDCVGEGEEDQDKAWSN